MNLRRLGRCTMVLVLGTIVTLLATCLGPIGRPLVGFSWCPDGRRGMLDYAFTSTSMAVPGQVIVRAVWEFGDGTAPEEAAGPIEHLFPAPGSYAVTLTVTDSRGIRGTATRFVDVALAAFIDPTWDLTLGYPPTVSGVVGNGSENTLREVVVRVRFYDFDGVRLGEARSTIVDLAPRERARFEIAVTEFAPRVFIASVEIESFSSECDEAVAAATRRD